MPRSSRKEDDKATYSTKANESEDNLSDNARIVRPSYLLKASHQKDLLRRLRKLTSVLQHDDTIEPADVQEWPGLAAVAQLLATELLRHTDKQVRLLTVTACMEILAIYAPECPWNATTLCRLFATVCRQVGNLSHCTTSSAAGASADYVLYARILELLAHVKIGVVLVELATECKDQVPQDDDGNHDGDDSDDIASFRSGSSSSNTGDSSSGSSHTTRRPVWYTQLNKPDPIEAPLTLLVRFFRTLLQSVRREHNHTVQTQIVQALTACLEEYNPTGLTVPIPVLDELLLSLATGPTTKIIDPAAAANTKKPVVRQIAVENPTFTAAAKCLQKTVARLVTPTASLLAGLLQADPYTVSQSSIAADPAQAFSGTDVWSVVRYLHRVAPAILTAVWGAVQDALVHPDADQRLAAVQLVGYTLQARPSADNLELLQAWWQRQHDVNPNVRQALCQPCLTLTAHWAAQEEQAATLSTLQTEALNNSCRVVTSLVVSDTTPAVRLAAIHAVCEALYRQSVPPAWATPLLQAIGKRVSARPLNERQDALTGLVKLYEKNYMRAVLVVSPEHNNDLLQGLIPDLLESRAPLVTLKKNLWSSHQDTSTPKRRRDENEKIVNKDEDNTSTAANPYQWIPQALCCAVSFADMRSRVVQLVDEGLIPRNVTDTAVRAIGVAHVLQSLQNDEDNDSSNCATWIDVKDASAAMRFLVKLLRSKAALQEQLGLYLAERQVWRKLPKGTEDSLAAEARSLALLKTVSSLSDGPTDTQILKSLHRARDQHIFRLLKSLATPLQSKSARTRAGQELVKRCQFLNDDTSWMKQLVRRSGMGDFINADIVESSAELAQQCLEGGHVAGCAALLGTCKVAAAVFPELCGQSTTFTILRQIFSTCRNTKDAGLKNQLQEWRLVTTLSSILSQAAACRPDKDQCDTDGEEDDTSPESPDAFRKDLLRLCTGDGTPTQARHAVYTLSRLEESQHDMAVSSPSNNPMSRLVNKVASPLRLSATNEKQISLLSALTALADCAPDLLASQARGKKALIYALEDIFMGRRGQDDDMPSDDDDDEKPKSKRGRRSKSRHGTPKAQNVLEDESLSTPCRRLCAAIAFLVSHIRATFLQHEPRSPQAQEALSKEQIVQVFKLLVQILRDKGLPPNDRDRKQCDSRSERSALRRTAGVHLLRLCDPRLGLEKLCLSTAMWHTLGEAFLDEEKVVRETIMDEFVNMLKGIGVFGKDGSKMQAQAPALRFVAYVCLCVDADSSNESVAANGFAANVGKNVAGLKGAASTCVTSLRTVCDAMYNTCRANGTEEQFENVLKMRCMPEYMVPYALHLLALRRETPPASDADSSLEAESEAKDKILAKRLNALFEPLVRTLGEGADNISFLLRMTELLGRRMAPVPVTNVRDVSKLKAKLQKILTLARETLLSYVKTDVNLEEYPGVVNIPTSLFKKISKEGVFASGSAAATESKAKDRSTAKKRASSDSKAASIGDTNTTSSKKRRVETPQSKRKEENPHVHFSPDVKMPTPNENGAKKKSFGGISPIGQSGSPFASPPAGSIRETQTLGSTPPSGLGVATIQSTAPDSGTDADEESSASSKPVQYVVQTRLKLNPSDLASDDGGNNHTSPQTSEGSLLTLGKSSKQKSTRSSRSSTRRAKTPTEAQDTTLVTDEQTNEMELSQDTQESSIVLGGMADKGTCLAKQGMERKEQKRRSRGRAGKPLDSSQDDEFSFMSSQDSSSAVANPRSSPRGKTKVVVGKGSDQNALENVSNSQGTSTTKHGRKRSASARSSRALRTKKA